MTLTRRRFFLTLLASAVAAKVALPVGLAEIAEPTLKPKLVRFISVDPATDPPTIVWEPR